MILYVGCRLDTDGLFLLALTTPKGANKQFLHFLLLVLTLHFTANKKILPQCKTCNYHTLSQSITDFQETGD